MSKEHTAKYVGSDNKGDAQPRREISITVLETFLIACRTEQETDHAAE